MADKLMVPHGVSLSEFLTSELQGSSLSIRKSSKNEFFVESSSIIRIHILVDDVRKKVNFDLFSPRWSRRITVQQLDGIEFMESQAEEEPKKDEAEAITEDSLLALDLIRLWANERKYESIEIPPTPTSEDVPAKSKNRRPRS